MIDWQKLQHKYLRIGPYGYLACGIIVFAVLLRIALIAMGWPLLDSDEGTMGLMGMHIAFRHEYPIFFYAQGYMGGTEAYLASVPFQLFGVSSFTLRLGLILMFAVFLVAMYLLTGLLYSKRLALITLLVLALGSNPVLVRELVAVGGDPDTLMSVAIVMLLTSWLALTSDPEGVCRNQRRRLLAFGAWGLAVGFTLFSHVLGAPFLACSALTLLLFCWKEIKGWASLCALVGVLIGITPIIIYNTHIPPTNKNTLFYIFNAMGAGGTPVHYIFQFKDAFMISLPTATGANPLCSVEDVNAYRFTTAHTFYCPLTHVVWPSGVMLLWGIAVFLALATLWSMRHHFLQGSWAIEERHEFIRNVIRLSLLMSCGGTLLLYALSPNAAIYPVATSRYLIGFLLATPALLWPLWRHAYDIPALKSSGISRRSIAVKVDKLSPIVRHSILILIVFILTLGVFSTITGIPAQPLDHSQTDVYFTQNTTQHLDVPAVQVLNRQEYDLIQHLLRLQVAHIYSDYWTCDRLIFQSQEQILCNVLGSELQEGHNRYPLYQRVVAADPYAAYVFHVHNSQDVLFSEMQTSPTSFFNRYQRLIFDGYAIYYLPAKK